MTHDDIRQQLTDYALGLLPHHKLDMVEKHLTSCSACRDAVQVERHIGQMVHSTLQIAAQPQAHRLQSLMPQPPQPRRLPWQRAGWQKQLAPLLVIFTLLIGAFASQRLLPSGSNLPGFVVTAYAATATSTNTPTATAIAGDLSLSDRPSMSSMAIRQEPVVILPVASQPPPHTPRPTPGAEDG